MYRISIRSRCAIPQIFTWHVCESIPQSQTRGYSLPTLEACSPCCAWRMWSANELWNSNTTTPYCWHIEFASIRFSSSHHISYWCWTSWQFSEQLHQVKLIRQPPWSQTRCHDSWTSFGPSKVYNWTRPAMKLYTFCSDMKNFRRVLVSLSTST